MMRWGVAGSNSPELAPFEAADVARELDAGGLHAEADAEVGRAVFARVADGVQHAFDAALAEAAGDEDAVEACELRFVVAVRLAGGVVDGWVVRLQAFGFDPGDLELEVVRERAVDERFLERFVAVFVLDILADDGDGDLVLRDCRRGGRCPASWRGRRAWRRCAGTSRTSASTPSAAKVSGTS